MKPTLVLLAFFLAYSVGMAQIWSPAIRSTQKVGIRFWQKNMPPIFLSDTIADPVLGYAMYGEDTTTVLGRWNFKDSRGIFNEMVFADFDGNGYNDCVVKDIMYLNAATPQQMSYPIQGIGRPVGIADLDADGMPDVCDGGSIHFGTGARPLTRKKYIKYPDYTERSGYSIRYMDTLGGKTLFLSSWGKRNLSRNDYDLTVAIETLDSGALQAPGDTVALRTLHTITFRSSVSLGHVPVYVFDDVWYVLHALDSGKIIAVSADTITVVTADPSLHSYKGIPSPTGSYHNNTYAQGGNIAVVDGRRPALVDWYDGSDTSWSLRYVTMQARNPVLRVQYLGDLNLRLAPDGKKVSAEYSFLLADVDGDGLEDVRNSAGWVVKGAPVDKVYYSSDIYITSGNVVSSVIAQTDPMSLPLAYRTQGGWLVRDADGCFSPQRQNHAYLYSVDGRLLAAVDVQRRESGIFLAEPVPVPMPGLLIAVIGTCVVRLQ